MPIKPKFPEGCRHLDLALVSRTLAEHRLDIPHAADALGVNRTDLRRLTWHDPRLLDEAKEVIELYRHLCTGHMIDELHSPERWRRRRAREELLVAFDHPMAPAVRPKPRPKNRPSSAFVVEMNRRRAVKKALAIVR